MASPNEQCVDKAGSGVLADTDTGQGLGIGSFLRVRALAEPDAVAFRYVKKGGAEVSEHRFGDLDLEARRMAAWLRAQGGLGDRVLLAHAPGPEFVAAFFACLYAGCIAVPAFPPRRARHGNRVMGILADAGCRLALADAVGRSAMETARRDDVAWAELRWPEPEDLNLPPLESGDLNRPDSDAIAFLQYTSGSTGSPKGVMVSHGNVEHNVELQRVTSAFEHGDVMASWVPFFHDMGLVYGLLLPLAGKGSAVYFSANDFLQTPVLWPKTLSRYGATHSAAPNFGYELCARVVVGEALQGLDLRRLKYCVNGSEPVRAAGVRAFEEAFAGVGLRRNTVQPAYGMSENTLFISAGGVQEALEEVAASEAGQPGRVVCGRSAGQTVVIVDPNGPRPCAAGETGEIWVQSESVAKGYWNRSAESMATFGARLPGFHGAFLRSGDLGCVRGERLVVSGRLKDLIILRGQNYYPQDLEETARSVSSELGTGAAFSIDAPEGEGLVLVLETLRHPKENLMDLAKRVAQAVTRAHGIQASEVVLVPPNAVPRTSSGKVQRRACREAYLDGGLKVSLRWPPSEALTVATPVVEERLAWIRAAATQLGGIEPPEGFAAPLDAWCLDSLKAAELSARYQREFGHDLEFLTRPDSSLLALLGGSSVAPSPVPPPTSVALPAVPQPLDAPTLRRWRCHPALESIWAFQKATPESNAYHMGWTAHLAGRPDLKKLTSALRRLSLSEGGLRSYFELDEESRLWQVESLELAPLEEPWAGEGSLVEARTWAETWSMRPFDPGSPPLWRAAYLPLVGGGCLLAFVFHHLIFDQRSVEAFHEKLDELVRDPEAHRELQVWVPPQRTDDPSHRERARAYWQERLKGLKPEPWVDNAMLSCPRAPNVIKAELPKETMDALRHVAASARCTLFTVAALAWAEALAELSNTDEACFIIPSTLRDRPLSDGQIGYWVHPQPLRLCVERGRDLRERLVETSKAVRDLISNRGLSAAGAMRAAGLGVPAAMLAVQGELHLPNTWLGSSVVMRQLPSLGCKAGLALEVAGENAWSLNLEFHPLAVSEVSARRCFEAFLNACRRYAGEDRDSALSLLQGGSLLPSEHRTVVEAFHARVLLDADAPVLVSDRGVVDYGTLSAQVRAVAAALTRVGVGPGDRVGVCSQASAAWVAAMLGCFEVGAIYVPLDPAYPSQRLASMLADAQCSVVLSDSVRPAWGGSCLWMDLETALSSQMPFLRVPGRPKPEDAAYIIFTSGSSGRPKGVQVSHRALMNNATGIGARLRLGSGDRVSQFFSISFDPSLQDVFPIVVAGGCVVLMQPRRVFGSAELAAFVEKNEISFLHLPTAYWHAFMHGGGAEALKGIACLKWMMVGGEAPEPKLVREWNQVLGTRVTLYNGYGPTESCIAVTLFNCCPGDDFDGPVPLGLPLPGVELAVVGPDGRLLPAGEAGELWIAGASLADGYRGPGGLDRSRFCPAAPDGKEPRAFYRTGDLVHMDRRGRLVFRGRLDRQIKAAGVRLDLEEIENLLARDETVSGAVVEVEDSGEGQKLMAWVTAAPGQSPVPSVLMEWLRLYLPHSCLPSDIGVLKAFPIGPNGKTDRAALKKSSARNVEKCGQVQGPPLGVLSGGRVELLRTAFSEILKRPVGPDDDFFSLGGTSLRAVRLAGEASRRLEQTVSVNQIYHAPNPTALAALLEGTSSVARTPGNVLRLLVPGVGPDWVLLPPVSGNLDCYCGFAGLLAGRCRIWGLDVGMLPVPAKNGWDDWVEACVNVLESELKNGELVLGGWSMGGLLAADMARLLLKKGRSVRRLLLLDALVPDPLNSALMNEDPSLVEDLVMRDRDAEVGGGVGLGLENQRLRCRSYVGALAGFTLQPLDFPVSLAVSERSAREEPRSSWMAWSLMARRGITSHLVPGDHYSLLAEGNLRRLAERFALDVERGHAERLALA